jgi:hypothetical protein
MPVADPIIRVLLDEKFGDRVEILSWSVAL